MDHDFDPLAFTARCADIAAIGWADEAGIAARQSARLQALLAHAAAHSPLLARLWRGRRDFGTLPVLHKSVLMADFDDWVTDRRVRHADLKAFVADPGQVGAAYLGEFAVWQSSGSTGEPALFVQDRAALAVYDALEAVRSPGSAGRRWLDPWLLSERAALVVATGGHFASAASLARLRRLNPWWRTAMQAFSVLQPLDCLVAALNAFAPTTLATYPTAAALLADEALAGRLAIAPREVRTGGEMLSPALRRHVGAAFGCPVVDSYGASEFLCIAFECGEGRLHANTDWVILEPVDEHHRPTPPGEPSCTTLLTNLANHLQPLVRLDLGDGLRLLPGRCGCGSRLPAIEVQGRHDDTLRVARAGGGTVALLPLAVATVLEDEAGLVHFQLRQRSADTLELCVPGHAPADRAAARHAAAHLLEWTKAQGAEGGLRVQVRTAFESPAGASGKRQHIVALR